MRAFARRRFHSINFLLRGKEILEQGGHLEAQVSILLISY